MLQPATGPNTCAPWGVGSPVWELDAPIGHSSEPGGIWYVLAAYAKESLVLVNERQVHVFSFPHGAGFVPVSPLGLSRRGVG